MLLLKGGHDQAMSWPVVVKPRKNAKAIRRPPGFGATAWKFAGLNSSPSPSCGVGAVLQITGAFTNSLEFPAAASAGLLQLCVVTLTFTGDAW
ncbi:hypothetical protein ACPC54_38200 [Kitasatospora sp. NPDC094028]